MTSGEAANSSLAAALAVLSSQQPEAHSARMEDLAYLANVLIAGSTHEGRKLRPVEALEAAVATCNLGLELWERSGRATTVQSDARLLQQVGCDRLFRVGWPALQRELVEPARRSLKQCCANLDTERAREAQKLIAEETVFSLRIVCRASELELEDEAFDALLALAETLPWLVAEAHPWIGSRADLDRARRRLAELARADAWAESRV